MTTRIEPASLTVGAVPAAAPDPAMELALEPIVNHIDPRLPPEAPMAMAIQMLRASGTVGARDWRDFIFPFRHAG